MSRFTTEAAGITASAERKSVRSIRLSVKPPDGRVEISIPRRASVETVKRFMEEKRDWILEKQEMYRARAEKLNQNVNSDTFMLWGRPLPLTVVEGAGRDSVSLENGQVIIRVRQTLTSEQRVRLLDELCREQLNIRLAEVTPKWERVTGVSANEWRTRVMKTRWGSCNIDKKRIWINVRLAMLPPECLDEVIVHELCHLYEPGHNQRFRAYMDRFYPNWRQVRAKKNELSGILA